MSQVKAPWRVTMKCLNYAVGDWTSLGPIIVAPIHTVATAVDDVFIEKNFSRHQTSQFFIPQINKL